MAAKFKSAGFYCAPFKPLHPELITSESYQEVLWACTVYTFPKSSKCFKATYVVLMSARLGLSCPKEVGHPEVVS